MNYYILTLFPEMVEQGLHTSVIGNAIQNKHIAMECVNIRDYTEDKHRKVDDYPYGGGAGMLMQAQPIYDAYTAVHRKMEKPPRVLYLTPQGKTFTQDMAEEFAGEENLVFLCGHYEGVDERVLEEIVTDYISIGDYVLTGGELPAMVMIDAVSRLVPGVLKNGESARTETFHKDLLEYPQYSRPEVWKGREVPSVLLSGNHKKIGQYRLEESIRRTQGHRPDLYRKYERTECAIAWLSVHKLHHMNMIEVLRRGLGDLLEATEDGVLLREKIGGIYMMSTVSREAGVRLLESLEAQEIQEPRQNRNGQDTVEFFVVHQEYMAEVVRERFQMSGVNICSQAVYTRKEPLPSARKLTGKDIRIACLGMEAEQMIQEQYQMIKIPGYINDRLRQKAVYGAYLDGELAGFAGFHQEGSIGMVEVFKGYRKQGVATALEAYCINRTLEEGNVPFGQILDGNEASMELQKKLGHSFAKEKIYWVMK